MKESEHASLSSRHEHELQQRSATEIKKLVTGDIRKLNSRLLVTSNTVAITLQRHAVAKTPQGRIIVALFKKAVNTFRAIQLLKSDRLLEESFVLLRVPSLDTCEPHLLSKRRRRNGVDETLGRCIDA